MGGGQPGGEMLVVAVPAGDIRAFIDDRSPEELRAGAEGRGAGQLELAGGADELGDCRVGVKARELVHVLGRRPKDALMIEPQGNIQILLLTRQRIQVRQRLIHAAVFLPQHPLHLFVSQARIARDHPVPEFPRRLERLRIVAIHVHVLQAGEDLVQRVIRRPHVLPAFDPVNERLGKGA